MSLVRKRVNLMVVVAALVEAGVAAAACIVSRV